jgi:hypothetical protein
MKPAGFSFQVKKKFLIRHSFEKGNSACPRLLVFGGFRVVVAEVGDADALHLAFVIKII